jgi:hypothetical protein
MVGDDAHCADAVTGNAKTAAMDNAERTLVMFMTSNSSHTSSDDHIVVRAPCRTQGHGVINR